MDDLSQYADGSLALGFRQFTPIIDHPAIDFCRTSLFSEDLSVFLSLMRSTLLILLS